MRAFFYLLYHQFAWTYDWISWLVSLGMWQEWIAATLPYLHGPKVLELGPGPGHIQKALAKKGVETYALEASPQMSRLAYFRIKKDKSFPDVINGYAQFMPFQHEAFHQILATFPTPFVFEPVTLQQIFRVLVPGGECFILPAAWITASAIPYRWAARLFEITGQVPDTLPDWTGPFERAGFTVELLPIVLPRSRLILIHATKPDLTEITQEPFSKESLF